MGQREATAAETGVLLSDLRHLIEEARRSVATAVNASLTMLYWKIGRRISSEILSGSRAAYGDHIVVTLSRQLESEYGRGFAEKNMRRMTQFAECFPDEKIIVSLIRDLSWSHFVCLIPLKDRSKRDFYAEMCRIERWSVRTLRRKMDSMLFERTALSKKSDELIRQELDALRDDDLLTPDLVFRDPYLLDFLNLKDSFSEQDLEAAILKDLENFLIELGAGFSFVARQKRMVIDGEDHYLDLLFYHRHLKRLVAVELKLGKFRASDKGQLELYLRWLDKYEKISGEESPIGLIPCAESGHETVELLQLDKTGIHVSQYLTELPPRDLLAKKLHDAMTLSRARFESLGD